MKRLFTFCVPFIIAASAYGQCNELFISEYVEGSHNNKSLEIYNPGSAAVTTDNLYRVTRWRDGTAQWIPQMSDTLKGTIAANGTLVITLDRRNPAGTGQDTQVFSDLQAKTNLFLSGNYNVSYSMSFNGDDAMTLDKKVGNQWVPVDIFGKIGEDPGTSWTDSFPYNNGKGLWVTYDKTLIRKAKITKGVTTNPSLFNAKLEWDIFPRNMFDSLGHHICDCNKFPASVNSISAPQMMVFPNPANHSGEITVIATDIITGFTLSDINGRIIVSGITNEARVQISAAAAVAGPAILQINTRSGASLRRLVVIE